MLTKLALTEHRGGTPDIQKGTQLDIIVQQPPAELIIKLSCLFVNILTDDIKDVQK